MEREVSLKRVTVNEGTNLAAAVSPDEQTVVLSLQGTLFTIPIAGGVARAITDAYQDARDPTWSPDGARIAYHGYANGTWDIWEVSVEGGTPAALTHDVDFDDREPHYSPDGSAIAFASDRSGSYGIWVQREGATSHLVSGGEEQFAPAWSPDGERIAFVASDGSTSEIRVVTVDTGEVVSVASINGAVAGPAWHPSGNRISYQVLRRGQDLGVAAALEIVDLNSGELEVLTSPGADVFPFRATWVSDDRLVYTADGRVKVLTVGGGESEIPFSADLEVIHAPYERRRRDHDDVTERRALGLSFPTVNHDATRVAFTAIGDLWMMDTESLEPKRLTDDVFAVQMPDFNPDGTRLAYVSDRSDEPHIWMYDIEGRSHTRLDDTAGATFPTWSPDGNRIAYFAESETNSMESQITIRSLADGSNRTVHRPLNPSKLSWGRGGGTLAALVHRPDSKRYTRGAYRLAVFDLEDDSVTRVGPRNPASISLVDDGARLSYVHGGHLWRCPVDSEDEPERLTDVLADDPSWSTSGRHAVFMSGERMFLLDTGSGEMRDITPNISWTRDVPDARWVLRVGRLFDGTTDAYREEVDVIVDGNRIHDIVPWDPELTDFVDASAQTVIPGLFEMHTHLGWNARESDGRVWLAYGITTVRDIGGHPYVAKERQEVWDSGNTLGPRTHMTGYLMDGSRVFYPLSESMASEDHLRLALERAQQLQYDQVKAYVRLPDRWQKIAVEAAHAMGVPAASHELYPAARHGMDNVEHVNGGSRRGYHPGVSWTGHIYEDARKLVSSSGMCITPTVVFPGFHVMVDERPDMLETPQFETFHGEPVKQRVLRRRETMGGQDAMAVNRAHGESVRRYVEAGALVAIGTDAPLWPKGTSLHAELRLFAAAGLTPFQVLHAATYASATAAGVADDLGSLEPGKIADLVVLDGDPLAEVGDAENVIMTVLNGRPHMLEDLLRQPQG